MYKRQVWNLGGALELLNTVKRPNARLMVDTLHTWRSKVSVEELAACPKAVSYTHLDVYKRQTLRSADGPPR